MTGRIFSRLAAMTALAVALACGAAETSALLTAELDPSLQATQLRLTLVAPDATLRGPVVRPDAPAGPLGASETVRLVIPKDLESAELGLTVEALRDGLPVATASTSMRAQPGKELELSIRLERAVDPEACPASCPAGTECQQGACRCTPQACAGGCCDGDVCQAARLTVCGAGGQSCFACDEQLADRCAEGSCRCGEGPACAAGQVCVAGSCRCTPSACPNGCCEGEICRAGADASSCGSAGQQCTACPAGQTCETGVCSGCAQTCVDGCCTGTTCQRSSFANCGAAAGACVACDPVRTDTCSLAGQCRCGSGPPCGPGLRCQGGVCVCDARSCAGGCCRYGVCEERTMLSCGIEGATCVACDATLADNCSADGTCRCGAQGACGAGQRCLAGACVCDGTSCRAGCCIGNVCAQPTVATCGTGGAACASCSALQADSCAATGECRCGSGPGCGPDQRCVAGGCVCDPASCDGCCQGATCMPGRSLEACGSPGDACVTCDALRADACADGGCRCGDGPACDAGQRCSAGQCVCDAQSCAGCCQGTTCEAGDQVQACGAGGAACEACRGAKRCVGGLCA